MSSNYCNPNDVNLWLGEPSFIKSNSFNDVNVHQQRFLIDIYQRNASTGYQQHEQFKQQQYQPSQYLENCYYSTLNISEDNQNIDLNKTTNNDHSLNSFLYYDNPSSSSSSPEFACGSSPDSLLSCKTNFSNDSTTNRKSGRPKKYLSDEERHQQKLKSAQKSREKKKAVFELQKHQLEKKYRILLKMEGIRHNMNEIIDKLQLYSQPQQH